MTVKRMILLACLCAALSGCSTRESGNPAEAVPAPAPVLPEQSESETIDPYEKAATISAPEEPASSEAAGQEEIIQTEGGDLPPSSSASGTEERKNAPAESSFAARSGSAQGSLTPQEVRPAPESTVEVGEGIAAERKQEPSGFTQSVRIEISGSGTSGIEQKLIRLINNERARNGVEALGVEDSMQLAAGIRAKEALQSLSHTRPGGTPYYTAFDEAGFRYAGKWHGENLAMISIGGNLYDEEGIAEALFRQWLESPGHQQNMLGDNFLQTGVGVYVEKDEDAIRVGAAQLLAGF